MSDDDEKAMEISSTSSQSDNEGPSKKRTKTSAVTDNGDTDAAPKWSNPDPYTALPCPDDTYHKKKDVVALIRKARNEEDKDSKAATEAEDFIALDSSEDEKDEAPPSAPVQITLGKRAPPVSRPPPPAAFQETTEHGRRSPSPPRGPLGTRKRMLDDEIKHSEHGRSRKSLMKPVNGIVTPDWKTKNGEDPNPWAVSDHGDTPEPSVRYRHKPRPFFLRILY
jgi:non-canonical poly(A) RNA polymerase PAPD5/7